MKPSCQDASILTTARHICYGLLGGALAIKGLALLFGLLGATKTANSGQAHTMSHSLSHISGALAMSGVSLGLLAIAYWASVFIRPVGYSLDDGHKSIGIVRFAIEVGVIIGAGVLALVMSGSSGHGLVGFTALAVALAYGVFRAVEFFGAARLGRLGGRLGLGRLGAKTSRGADNESKSYAEGMREYRASQQDAGKLKPAERAVNTADATTESTTDTAGEHLLPATPARPLDEVLADIDSHIGLSDFKAHVRRDLAFQRAEKMKAEADPEYQSSHRRLHCIYSGPPGTGKTMSAKLHAEAYTALGISNGRFAATSVSKLLSGVYIGTARKVLGELLHSATGGVVFLDEFAALLNARGSTGNMGSEVVEELLDRLENDESCPTVIVAGYEDLIDTALAQDAGFASRFRNRFLFVSYTPDELLAIAEAHIHADRHRLSSDARAQLRAALSALYERYATHPAWSSARVAVTLYQKAKEAQSEALHARVQADPAYDLMRIEAADIDGALAAYLAGKPYPEQSKRQPGLADLFAA